MIQVAYTDKGYRVYRTVNAVYRLYVGPAWPTPKEAARYADALEAAADVSPLRASTEASAADPQSPPDGRGWSDASVESRERDSGLEDRPE